MSQERQEVFDACMRKHASIRAFPPLNLMSASLNTGNDQVDGKAFLKLA